MNKQDITRTIEQAFQLAHEEEVSLEEAETLVLDAIEELYEFDLEQDDYE
jgi:hypothetical protein